MLNITVPAHPSCPVAPLAHTASLLIYAMQTSPPGNPAALERQQLDLENVEDLALRSRPVSAIGMFYLVLLAVGRLDDALSWVGDQEMESVATSGADAARRALLNIARGLYSPDAAALAMYYPSPLDVALPSCR